MYGVPVPERARVVKGGLGRFCRLRVLGIRVKVRTIYVVRIGGVLLGLVVVAGGVLGRLVRTCSTGSGVTVWFARSVRSFFS